MAENVAETVTIPEQVIAAPVETAQTDDEDYKWLTERLDAHQTQLATLHSTMMAEVTALKESLRMNQDQSRIMIESLTTLVTNLTSDLTALATSAALRLTLPVSESSSQAEVQPEPIAETVVVQKPVAAEQTQELVEESGAKKRRRM